jgi:CRP/FNR family cyclic AMP-dependent transcriptional regulator
MTTDNNAGRVLSHVPIFTGLDQPALDALALLSSEKTFRAGEVIIAEGDTSVGLFVILRGRAEIVKDDGTATPVVLSTLSVGSAFGELALLGEWKRVATVRAVEETRCLGIDRWQFLAHLQKEPAVAVKMLQYVARRLVENEARTAPVPA